MITLKELTGYLSTYLDPNTISDYCPNGLQVEGKSQIKKGAFAVSASLNVIREAVAWGADFLFVHHGIFWDRDPYPIVGSKKNKIKCLIESDTSLIAYHLPLDAHKEVGNNWKAAGDLGWKELTSFRDIGVKGTFPPCTRNAFIKQLETYYGRDAQMVMGGSDEISSAALISGGAYKEIVRAAAEGVGAYVTGNVDEPAWHLAHEEKINFFALGHAATEKVGPKAIMNHLKKTFNLDVLFIEENNPF